ncbi:MAG: beta-ketoacyl-[acyl-carrier-protein] synthase II [Dehalococcoidia bacterium]|nr:MAG: beta-ketoacyl-[acyl-carrier-protein] synthase II [Dehalococcoidia bacterium]
MKNGRRVVITGAGALTPVGIGVKQTWDGLCEGRSGITRITRFDPSAFGTQIAGEVKGFDATNFMDRKVARRTDLFAQYAIAATRMALSDANLEMTEQISQRTGVILGTTMGGIGTLCHNVQSPGEGNFEGVSKMLASMYIPSAGANDISVIFGIRGPSRGISTACATGGHAIGDAVRFIQYGEADVMVAGASEAQIVPVFVDSMARLRATTTHNSEPERASRPFDLHRDGLVSGEGAGVLVLEELQHARDRGAHIYAEITGFASNIDAYHATKPEFESQARCITLALQDAQVAASDVVYVNAHGTSTILGDLTETMALKRAFGDQAKRLMVSSNKSMLGHMWSASGAVDAILTAMTLETGVIPPTTNYETPDPECDLDYVPNVKREAPIRTAVSESFGFGGMNAVLVFSRWGG